MAAKWMTLLCLFQVGVALRKAGRLSSNGTLRSSASCGAKGFGSMPVGTPVGQIVNGEDAAKCAWKWQVYFKSFGEVFCGGALISDRWVLTAAHCTYGQWPGDFEVVAGGHNWKKNDGQSFQVKTIKQHPRYNVRSAVHDIALVELTSRVPMTSCIGTVCLPGDSEKLQTGTRCWITGWGTLTEGGRQPDILQEAEVTTVGNSACARAYEKDPDNYRVITSDMACAQGVTSSGSLVDSCQGDSGGPLVCDKGGGRWVLHGATSWGKGCAKRNFPGAYSRTQDARGWIRKETGL